jgi:hypothetical protein
VKSSLYLKERTSWTGRKPRAHPTLYQGDSWAWYGQPTQIHIKLPDLGYLIIYLGTINDLSGGK